jgi:ABC-type antimicrobial peptide transport system permease subunit
VLNRGTLRALKVPERQFSSLMGKTVQVVLAAPRGQKQSYSLKVSGISSEDGQRVEISTPDRLAMKGWWFNDADLLKKEGYDSVTLRAADVTQAKALVTRLRKEKLNVQSIDAILDVANKIFTAITAMLGLMSSVALFVAFIGIANTMIMSIYERTREIGTLKAMGASSGDIRQMFMLEAGLIGLFGGVAGVASSWVLGQGLDRFAHWMARQRDIPLPDQLFLITPMLVAQALIFAFVIGILAGLYPAHRAARLDPLVALRHE